MALQAVETEVLLTFRDRENTIARTRFFLPQPGLLQVNAQTIYTKAQTLTGLIAAISDCQLIDMAVKFQDRDDVSVGAGEVERKGKFIFAVAGGTPYTTLIPGFKDTMLDTDKRSIAITGASVHAEVQAFLDAIINGPASFNNGGTNAAGVDLARAVDAFKVHVRSLQDRRGRSG